MVSEVMLSVDEVPVSEDTSRSMIGADPGAVLSVMMMVEVADEEMLPA